MKPLYSPATVQFRVMKEQPEVDSEGTVHFPWATFFPNGIVHTWDRGGVGGENWNANDYPDENKYLQALARTPYKNPAPFLPGEKCYLREVWAETCDEYGSPIIVYRADNAAYYIGEKQILAPCEATWSLDNYPACGKWCSPVTMPSWAARRFFAIVSCTPMRIREVTEKDAKKTGLNGGCLTCGQMQPCGCDNPVPDARESLAYEWEQKYPGTWPGVWVWKIVVDPAPHA